MKTLFIGGTKRGHAAVRALVDAGAELAGIISLRQDEHEVERYEEALRGLAQDLTVPLYESKRMRDRDYAELVARRYSRISPLWLAVGY